eukprot:TRINITY_DN1589_c0_g1_i2.p1 TRINITY_DN1589_c0_g1~~TRINITY_DN1589_c0_g1_i2.p1  ORF type:complete len:156 (+),score=31.98 TRINITY_DN1589_c0_g1_i2:51-470(+)
MLRATRCLPKALAIGDTALSPPKQFTLSETTAFLKTIGDANHIHTDIEKGIVPGMLSASLISGVMGTQLPGPGSVYLSQTMKFRAPAKFSDVLTAQVTVTQLSKSRRTIRMDTVVRNSDGKVVVEGEALGMNDNPSLWE